MAMKRQIISHLMNIPGFRTKRRIVVFESDDWGTVRTSSKDSYSALLKLGYEVNKCPYNRNDALESNDDLERLFEILLHFKDCKGNHPVITANNIVANPDFDKIRDAQFNEYFYEPFSQTLNRYPHHDKVIEYYHEGIRQGIFRPQFHGREHVNVRRWLAALRSGDSAALDAFNFGMFTLHKGGVSIGRKEYLDSFGGSSKAEHETYDEILREGLSLFEDLWGYRSKSFIAPCYIWPMYVESVLSTLGVTLIQGTHVQRIPSGDQTLKVSRKYHYTGQRNRLGQMYLVRNVFFEPSWNGAIDHVGACMREIDIAFRWKKPAVISSHRVNYIGSICKDNRDQGLRQLERLIAQVLKKYPDVEFLSSDALIS
jgi:hypothetical protein